MDATNAGPAANYSLGSSPALESVRMQPPSPGTSSNPASSNQQIVKYKGPLVRWDLELRRALELLYEHQTYGRKTNWKAIVLVFNHVFHNELRAMGFQDGIDRAKILSSQYSERSAQKGSSIRWIKHASDCAADTTGRVAAIDARVLQAEKVLSQMPHSRVRDPTTSAWQSAAYSGSGTSQQIANTPLFPNHDYGRALTLGAEFHTQPVAAPPKQPSVAFKKAMDIAWNHPDLQMVHISGLRVQENASNLSFRVIPWHGSPFLPSEEEAYIAGGQVSRIRFVDQATDFTQDLDCMVCTAKYCEVCCGSVAVTSRTTKTSSLPFVHAYDIEHAAEGLTAVYAPEIQVRYGSDITESTTSQELIFLDGTTRTVLVCDIDKCSVCPAMEEHEAERERDEVEFNGVEQLDESNIVSCLDPALRFG